MLVEVLDVIGLRPQPVVELRRKELLHVALLAGVDRAAFHGKEGLLVIKYSWRHNLSRLNHTSISGNIRDF